MFKYLLTLALIFSLANNFYAQSKDSLQVNYIKKLEAKIDSLSKNLEKLDKDIKQNKITKKDTLTSGVDELLTLINVPDTSIIPDDQRSKRKRVDELLKAIEERPGVLRFNGGATGMFQGGLQKSINKINASGSMDIFAFTSFGKGTLIFFDIEGAGGVGINQYIPTFAGLNADAESLQSTDAIDRLQLLEAWAEFTIFDNLFTVTAGKIDLTNYFDNNAYANDETLQFISNSFVNSSSFIVPGNSPGIRFRTTILDRFYFQFAFSSVDNSGSDILHNVYKIASTGFSVLPKTDWEANIRFYNFWHPLVNNATGFGVSYDETIFNKYQIFARYGKNSTKLADFSEIRSSWSAGFSFLQNIENQGVNIGLAYGETNPANNQLNAEKIMEIYARYQFNKWIYLSPHFQKVWNNFGSNDKYSILSLRVHFNF